jgi:hypothetical protein
MESETALRRTSITLLEDIAHYSLVAQAKCLAAMLEKDIEPDGDWDDLWANADLEKFRRHFDDHRRDFSAKNWNDYAKKSQDFYKGASQEKLPTVQTKDGHLKIYDPKTNTFGVYNSEGKTETFYKPTSPTYYEREVQKVLNDGGRVINPMPTG